MNGNLLTGLILLGTTFAAQAAFDTIDTTPLTQQTQINDAAGQQTAARLTERYRKTPANCGAESAPAFLCSGIVMRGTKALTDAQFANTYAYAPNAAALKTGSSSFDYLRADSNNLKLTNNYTSGFIFYPVLPLNTQRSQVQVLCYFPLDGNSNARNQEGCGEYPGYEALSRSCTDQGINTGELWLNRYNEDRNTLAKRCSFNVRDTLNAPSAANFRTGLRAKQLTNKSNPGDTAAGSLKLANWPMANTADARKAPIEAFFYLNATGTDVEPARQQAKKTQLQFYRISGLGIPVIRVELPGSYEGVASFTYHPQDQN